MEATKLSLLGRVVVANLVLVSSMWVVAKVAWSTLIRPISEGGLGLLDVLL